MRDSVEEAQEYIWHDDNDCADPNRSCYRNPLQQELDESKEAFDEEDVVYAMAGSVEILLPTEPQWHEIGRGYEVRVHFGGRINAS